MNEPCGSGVDALVSMCVGNWPDEMAKCVSCCAISVSYGPTFVADFSSRYWKNLDGDRPGSYARSACSSSAPGHGLVSQTYALDILV